MIKRTMLQSQDMEIFQTNAMVELSNN
ncbi:Protein of unknown function [Escherichia coli]|nr:Protein of unknown function [Escherichia coli]CDU41750.1 Protein of unknown function [Escherichia coli]